MNLNDTNYQNQKDVISNIETIFRLAPPIYEAPKTGSDSTRDPAPYDKHLSEDLVLKKVVFSPNFAAQLGKVADTALEKAILPSIGSAFWRSAFDIEMHLQRRANDAYAVGEVDVVSNYLHDVHQIIVNIASALEFPSSSWETQFIKMFISDSKEIITGADERKKHKYALADAILAVNPKKYATEVPHNSQMVRDMETVVDYFKRIIPFEFKNHISGSHRTMLGILEYTQEETFPWVDCSSDYCAYEHAPELGRKPVTGDPRGFDAANMDVILETTTWEDKDKENPKSVNEREKKHAKNMLHQVWSQMVKYDATFSVLHAGLHELIFMRDRKNQSLCVSDLIEPQMIGRENPNDPGYYQIHIGLYIAAIRDARDRAKQLKAFQDFNGALPSFWTRAFDCGYGVYKTVTPRPDFDDVVPKYPILCMAWPKKGSLQSIIKNRPYYRNGRIRSDGDFFLLEARESTAPNFYLGTLRYREHRLIEMPVVIRTASDKTASARLYREWALHERLSKIDRLKVQKPYGYFVRKEGEKVVSVLLLQYAGTMVPSLRCLQPYQKASIEITVKLLHREKLVHGRIGRSKIFLDADDTPEGLRRRGGKFTVPWLVDLSRVRVEPIDRNREKEGAKLARLVSRARAEDPSPSCPILLGPVSTFADAQQMFNSLTSWMSPTEPWIMSAKCSIWDAGAATCVRVKFAKSEDAKLFMEAWYSQSNPFRYIACTDGQLFLTSSQPSSRASSEALSPGPSQGV